MQFYFDNTKPIYLQLVEQLELYIISGKIPPGSKLPSVRELAAEAEVNPNTMQRALLELENLKLISTERTNGKFVTDNFILLTKYQQKFAQQKVENFCDEMRELGFDNTEIISLVNINLNKREY